MRSFWRIFLLIREITVTAHNKPDVAFTNCAPFSTCKPAVNDLFKPKNCTKFETGSVKSSLWDYFDAFILVTGDITVTLDNSTDLAFTTCAPFSTCNPAVNDLYKQNNSTKFETESIKSSLWECFDPFIFVTGDVTVTGDNNTDVAFTICETLSTCETEINDLFKQNNSAKFETESNYLRLNLIIYFSYMRYNSNCR